MKSVHPPEVGLHRHCLPVFGNLRMFFSMSLGFNLEPQKPHQCSLCPADEVWGAALQSLGENDVLDLGIAKKEAEWLMAGEACAPEGSLVEGLPIQVRVGTLQREFLVSGPCEDVSSGALDIPRPRPFSRLPLQWAHTYGGPNHAENPLGCGMPPTEEEKKSLKPRPMPNVFAAGENLAYFSQPACPGPRLLLQSPPVVSGDPLFMGTYNAQWLQKCWPGVPEDFDWHYYNMAQKAQRQTTPFTGQEDVYISNMHEKYPVLQGKLPHYTVRFFANYGTEEKNDWREAAVRMDTVWLFPNALRGLVFWRAHIPVQDERATDISSVAISFTAPKQATMAEEQQHQAQHCINTAAQPLIIASEEVPLMSEDLTPPPAQVLAPAAAALLAPPVQISPPEIPQTPNMPTMPAPAPQAPAPLFDMNSPQMQKEMQEMLDITNAELAKHNLPPLTKDDLAVQMQKLEDMQKQALELQNAPQPSLEETLQQAGFSPLQSENLMKAMELQPPSPSSFLHKEEYEVALQEFLDRFTKLTDAPPSVQEQLLMGLRMQEGDFSQHPELEQAMNLAKEHAKAMANNDESLALNTLTQQFAEQGMPLNQAQSLAKAISLPMPEEISATNMQSYMQNFEAVAGFPEGSMTSVLSEQIGMMRLSLYSQPDLHTEIERLALAFPEQSSNVKSMYQELPKLENLEAILHGETSFNANQDLLAMAQGHGITDPRILTALVTLDPLPQNSLPKAEKQEQPEEQEQRILPPPIIENITEDSVIEPTNGQELVQVLRHIQSLAPAIYFKHKQALQAGNYSNFSFIGLDCSACDFSGLILNNANFGGANLNQASFAQCQLEKALFIQSVMEHTSFHEAHLGNATLSQIEGQNITLSNALLQGARIERCTLKNVQAENAVFDEAHIAQCHLQGNFSKTSFSNSQCKNVQWLQSFFDGAEFTLSTLWRCQLQGQAIQTTFMECTLEECILTQLILENARLYSLTLKDVNMQEIQAAHSNWYQVQANNITLDLAIFTEAILEECVFQQLQAARMSARGARFLACHLRGARLQRLDLYEGSLRSSLLDGASLEDASLYGADLSLAEFTINTGLSGTDLGRTCLTRLHRLAPEGA